MDREDKTATTTATGMFHEEGVHDGASFHEEGIHDRAGRGRGPPCPALRVERREHGPWRKRSGPGARRYEVGRWAGVASLRSHIMTRNT